MEDPKTYGPSHTDAFIQVAEREYTSQDRLLAHSTSITTSPNNELSALWFSTDELA